MIPKVNIALIGKGKTHKKEIIKYWLSLRTLISEDHQYSKIFWINGKPFMLIICKMSEAIPGEYDGIVYMCKGVDDLQSVQTNMRVFKDSKAYQCTIMLDRNPSTTLFSQDLYTTTLDHATLRPVLNAITTKVFNMCNISFTPKSIETSEVVTLEDYYVPIEDIDRDCCKLI